MVQLQIFLQIHMIKYINFEIASHNNCLQKNNIFRVSQKTVFLECGWSCCSARGSDHRH